MTQPNNVRQSVPRRKTPPPHKYPMVPAPEGEAVLEPWSNPSALKVVFVDDEGDFLEELEQQNAKRREVDLRCLLLTEKNHVAEQLLAWWDEGWRPDLLCIDLNEAHGKGVAGIDYLRHLRSDPRWVKLPIVLTTKTKDGLEKKSSSELVNKVYAAGADGYLLGKEASRAFLKGLLLQWPSWRHSARSRLWQQVLESNRKNLQGLSGEDELKGALQKTLDELCERLDIDHAFVRRGPPDNCPVLVKKGGDWAAPSPVTRLSEIPLMQDVLDAAGKVTPMARIQALQVGPMKQLVGKAYMGCALMHGSTVLGVILVVCDQAERFGALDRDFFQRLAEQVSHAMAAQLLERKSRTMRDALLTVSSYLARTASEEDVCQALAQVAHTVLHEGVLYAKCTVRLVLPGYPLLRRYATVGKVVSGSDISLKLGADDKDSMYRHAVQECRTIVAHTRQELQVNNYLDNNKNEAGQHWWTSQSAITVPLLWERPDSTPGDPKQSAMGAFNLECGEEGQYRDQAVQGFLQSLALSASQRIAAIRSAGFADKALDLAVDAYSKRPDELWKGLNDTLFALLGHNHLIQLVPPADWDGQSVEQSWRVMRVFSSDAHTYTDDVERWNAHFSKEDWQITFTRSCIERFLASLSLQPQFTAHKEAFDQAFELTSGEDVQANAVFPLWVNKPGEKKRLGGVVLLSWLSPPSLNRDMFQRVLGGFANYGSQLLQHSADLVTGEERLSRAESQATVAFAARQFEHVLNNRLAALQGAAEAGLMGGGWSAAERALNNIRTQLAALDERARKAALYLKPPKFEQVAVSEVWDAVVGDLSEKARREGVEVSPWEYGEAGGTRQLRVATDRYYLWNVFYVLVDNAIEALSQQPGERKVWLQAETDQEDGHVLQVCDNGPGVAQPDKLFQWGESSKAHGQGIALTLARERMKALNAELTYARQGEISTFCIRIGGGKRYG